MKIDVEVKGSDYIVLGLQYIPRIGEEIVYEYTENYIVRNIKHYVGFGEHEITVIVEKL